MRRREGELERRLESLEKSLEAKEEQVTALTAQTKASKEALGTFKAELKDKESDLLDLQDLTYPYLQSVPSVARLPFSLWHLPPLPLRPDGLCSCVRHKIATVSDKPLLHSRPALQHLWPHSSAVLVLRCRSRR